MATIDPSKTDEPSAEDVTESLTDHQRSVLTALVDHGGRANTNNITQHDSVNMPTGSKGRVFNGLQEDGLIEQDGNEDINLGSIPAKIWQLTSFGHRIVEEMDINADIEDMSVGELRSEVKHLRAVVDDLDELVGALRDDHNEFKKYVRDHVRESRESVGGRRP
jgi:hypothetical protein